MGQIGWHTKNLIPGDPWSGWKEERRSAIVKYSGQITIGAKHYLAIFHLYHNFPGNKTRYQISQIDKNLFPVLSWRLGTIQPQPCKNITIRNIKCIGLFSQS